MTLPRRAAGFWHRWVGLGLAGFLIVVGLTGSALAWNDELERVFAPSLFVLPPGPRAPALDIFTLREMAARAVPGMDVGGLDFIHDPDRPVLFYAKSAAGDDEETGLQIALDPATGAELDRRRPGDISEGAINLVPFVYRLHDTLLLGSTGALVLGVVALLWTIDCFIGAWLTFPASARPRRSPARWLKAWKKAWQVRRGSQRYKLVFDLHRAGGLWLWAMLFILAWSAVAFNLEPVYRPVMTALFGYDAPEENALRTATTAPRLGWREAHARGVAVMADVARQRGFSVERERLMYYDPGNRSYAYRIRSSLDVGDAGNTQVRIDGDTGRLIDVRMPTGGATGTAITTWIGEIHTGGVFGLPMKLLLTVVGFAMAVLSITGVLIWNRKRRAARHHGARQLASTTAASGGGGRAHSHRSASRA